MRKFALALLIPVLLVSCIKDKIEVTDIDSSISPEFGVPVAKATIFAEDVIERYDEDGLLTTDGEGVLTLVYQDTLESITPDDYLDLDEQTFSDEFEINAAAQSALEILGTIAIEQVEWVELDFDEDRLDSIRFEDGFLTVSVSSDGELPISGTVSILDPFSDTEVISAEFSDSEAPINAQVEQDFSNLLMRLRNDAEYANAIRVSFRFQITDNGGEYPDNLFFDFGLTQFSVSSVGGYVAPRTLQLDPMDANVNIFDTDYEGTIRLEDPGINLYFFNGYGIGVRPVINQITGENNAGGTLVVDGSQIEQLPIVAAAQFPGDVGISQIRIDNETMTPTVTDFMAFEPNYVVGDVSLEINPNNDESNFISAGSSLDVNFEVELPIFGSIADFSLVDTTAMNLGDVVESVDDFQELEQLDLRVFVRNELPLETELQLVFTDSLWNPIDSLFEETLQVIPSAPVDLSAPVGSPDYGRVIGDSETRIDVAIPRERIQALENATRMIIRVSGNTTGNGDNPIRLYPENFIEVNLAAKARFNLELE